MNATLTQWLKPIQKHLAKAKRKAIKHSPDILVVAGVGSMIVGTGLAIKASLDVKDTLTDAAAELEAIREDEKLLENDPDVKSLTKAKAKVYFHYGLDLGRMYAPAAIFVLGGAASVFKGHNILQKRNVALAASYASLESAYSAYKKRVEESVGAAKAEELDYNIQTEKVKDDKGKKRSVSYADPEAGLSMYAYPFKSCYPQTTKDGQTIMVKNPYFQDEELFDTSWIKSAEVFANLQLESKGYVYLSDVYDRLGITARDNNSELASRVMGWVDDGTIHPISFFSYIPESVDPYEQPEYLLRDKDGNVILDFNVQGNVLDMM